MNIPDKIRDEIKKKLWAEADRLEWAALSATDKAKYYSVWTETPDIGGKLAGFMDPRKVRVYIKDTLLKPYARERSSSDRPVLKVLGLKAETETVTTYIKPHGRRLADGREIAWSRASEWKATLMAIHERAFEHHGRPFAAVFFESGSKHGEARSRATVEDAATKLGISRVVWID
jgi:hypothetical protein